jgi:L-alanine-DL-glutamate epimerase-like enolase superfamily enzyme
MRIVAVKEQTIDLSTAARNADISYTTMTASAIVVQTDAWRNGKQLVGLAFDSIGRYGHGGLLRERFIPRLISANPSSYADAAGGIDPHLAWHVLMSNEKPGGHGERCGAVGLIDAALWDLAAKYNDEPLWSFLARRHGLTGVAPNPKIGIYASGGHYRASNDVEGLRQEVQQAISLGHSQFKLKIGGASVSKDQARIERVLSMLGHGMTLAVDGNGTFDRSLGIRYLEMLTQYPLAWVEEPAPPLDFDRYREITASFELPIATGENLFSRDDAQNLLRYAGLRGKRDFLQFDISLSYGIVEYVRILELLKEYGWQRNRCAPHAGHLFAMHCVAGLGLGLSEVAMDYTQLFAQLTADVPIEGGVATLPDVPGVGFEYTSAFPRLFNGLLN